MKVNSKSYPHPVLGNEDDAGGYFRVSPFHYELKKDEVILNPIFSIKNLAIEELIREEKASFVTEVECRSTFFRTSYSTRKPVDRFSIPAKLIRERVTVGFYVCADRDISGYKPSECHPDYDEASFEIEAGDVLAVGGYTSFIAEKNFDPLRPPVSSFMSIMEGNHHEGPMQINYENEKITIELSKADWRVYFDVRNQKIAEGMLHASIVLPVLIDAIHQVQNGNSDYVDASWFGRLDAILDANSLRSKEPFEAAQKILEMPLSRGLKSIESLLDTNGEEEYE